MIIAISIHAPHEGERLAETKAAIKDVKFQSTLPTRGSDFVRSLSWIRKSDFNPRSPRGGATLLWFSWCAIRAKISIHAPHEGERLSLLPPSPQSSNISIHAPHEGERHAPGAYRLDIINISIHAPHEGERPKYKDHPAVAMLFQSTLPTRGSDLLPVAAIGIDLHFNPRSPRGGATAVLIVHARGGFISIHAPHEGERQKPPFRLLR